MGQSQSSSRRLDQSFELLQNTFAKVDEEYIEDTRKCCLYTPKTRRAQRGLNWKQYMIRQLNGLAFDRWPLILSKYLSSNHNQNLDMMYQNQVIYAVREEPLSMKKGKSQGANSEVRGRPRGISINKVKGDSFVVHSRSYSNPEIEIDNLNDSIRNLLYPSTIVKEQMFPSSYTDMVDFKVADKENYSSLLSETRSIENSQDRFGSSSVINKRLTAYKNNTVLNQLSQNHRFELQNSSSSQKMHDAIEYYKKIIEIIEKQLKEEKNIFCQLIKLFQTYFVNTFQNKIQEIKTNHSVNSLNSKVIERATLDLQHFIRILCHSINLFYDLQNLKKGKVSEEYTVFNLDNISNFITTMVFNEDIYNTIYELYKFENNHLEKLYRRHLKASKKCVPQDFGVPSSCCLNELTLLENLSNKGVLTAKTVNSAKLNPRTRDTLNLEEEDQSDLEDSQKGGFGLSLSNLSNRLSENSSSRGGGKFHPYEKSISILKQLRIQKSPIHKLKIIMKVVDSITNSIESFYRDLNQRAPQNLTGEQNFAIFCYILVKSGLKNVLAHCKIIQNFSTCNDMSSISGYYTSTLEICYRHIANMPL